MPKVYLEHNVEQGSPEWHALRRGRITGSRACDLFKRTSRGWASSRKKMIAKIAMEMLRGEQTQRGGGREQQRGHDYEPVARTQYEMATGCSVSTCGFLTRVDHPNEGVSPDGLVGEDGAIEIKVPSALDKHVEYLTNPDAFLDEYGAQLRHTIYVADRKWIDGVSYYPEAAPNLQLWRKRFTSADLKLADYPEMLTEVWAEIDAKVADLRAVQLAAMEAA